MKGTVMTLRFPPVTILRPKGQKKLVYALVFWRPTSVELAEPPQCLALDTDR